MSSTKKTKSKTLPFCFEFELQDF